MKNKHLSLTPKLGERERLQRSRKKLQIQGAPFGKLRINSPEE